MSLCRHPSGTDQVLRDNGSVNGPKDRADVLFTLPRLPRRVTLLGELPGWRAGLTERQLEVVDDLADVVVASEDQLEKALKIDASALIVEGSRTTAARLGPTASRFISLPLQGNPVLFVDIDSRAAAKYAFARASGHTDIFRTVRNVVVGTGAGIGLPPPVSRTIAVAMCEPAQPAFLARAVDELALPDGSGWVMLVSPGGVIRRNAFLIFPPGATSPQYVLKFARVRGLDAAFDREEVGFARVASAAASVQQRAPRYLGRLTVDDFHASVETPALGTRLSTSLRRPLTRAVKARSVERVAKWLVQVAGDSASRSGLAAERRAELDRAVIAWGLSPKDLTTLADELNSTPTTFQHNDLAEENVILDRGDFNVVDWEWAETAGLPFGDLVYFGAHVLRLVDGATEDAPETHFRKLMLGQAPSSPLFFGWVRAMAQRLELPAESVAPLITLSWLWRAELSRSERERAERIGALPWSRAFAERVTELWMRDPQLGLAWRAWHR